MGKKRTTREPAGPQYRKNQRIRVPEVRLIDENGEQAGIVETNEARRRAKELGLDLVEVSPQARPPVCKIMDYGKFLYQQRKKEKQGQGVSKGSSQLKELRVRPAIDKHDLSYRLDNGRKFLTSGHKVQVVCIFKGRQMAHPEHGFDVMKSVAESLVDVCKVEVPAKMMGRRMTMLLTPLGGSQKVKGASTTPKREKKDSNKGGTALDAGGTSTSVSDDPEDDLDDELDEDLDEDLDGDESDDDEDGDDDGDDDDDDDDDDGK
ncbi:MAG TPA: translation initiation factor IF-3 [Planctomycetota bacterium]|nr:translation initiation factor IF-3 [Planctomycetota bacterium]